MAQTLNTCLVQPPCCNDKRNEVNERRSLLLREPHHAWERGTNENTNGLIRQYLPKRESMASLTQYDCNTIARKRNRSRPWVTPGVWWNVVSFWSYERVDADCGKSEGTGRWCRVA